MPSVTRDSIRGEILKALYDHEKGDPTTWGMDRAALQIILGVSEKDMDFDMQYLTQRGLVRATQASGVIWLWAKITSLGIDVIENKDQYKARFPFVKGLK